jgi:anaerobic magnesium-protoporphyrin IX monomethyl ester cyclase
MRVLCLYSVESYVSLERPLDTANEIPFGISTIAAVLEHAGHDVDLIVLTPDTDFSQVLGDYINTNKPRLICMSAVTTQYWQMKSAAEVIKGIDPSIYLVIGGHHASLNPDDCLKSSDLDAICIGEGDAAVVALANTLESGERPSKINNLWLRDAESGEVEKNEPSPFNQDLDALPPLRRKLWEPWVNDINRMPSVLLGRGCPFRCTYCANHALEQLSSGRYVRFRSPEHIVREIRQLTEDYPEVTNIYLEVETIGANRKASFAIFAAVEAFNTERERNHLNKITFGVNFSLTSQFMRTEERIHEFLSALQRANVVTLNIGLESGSERLRKEVLRRPKYSNDEIIRFCKLAQPYGVGIQFFVLVGVPGETRKDFKDTIRVARAAQPKAIYLSIFYPYLGTDLAQVAIDQGLINPEDLDPRAERGVAYLDLPEFSRKEVHREYVLFYAKVYAGKWPPAKIAAHTFMSFMNAYPKVRTVYKRLMLSSELGGWLRRRYGSAAGSKVKARRRVNQGTRTDFANSPT